MYKIAPLHQSRGFSRPGPAVTSPSIANSLRLPSVFSYHHSLLARTPAAFQRNLAGDGPSIISCRGDNLIGGVHKKYDKKDSVQNVAPTRTFACVQPRVCFSTRAGTILRTRIGTTLSNTASLKQAHARTCAHAQARACRPEPASDFHAMTASTEGPLCLTIE